MLWTHQSYFHARCNTTTIARQNDHLSDDRLLFPHITVTFHYITEQLKISQEHRRSLDRTINNLALLLVRLRLASQLSSDSFVTAISRLLTRRCARNTYYFDDSEFYAANGENRAQLAPRNSDSGFIYQLRVPIVSPRKYISVRTIYTIRMNLLAHRSRMRAHLGKCHRAFLSSN